MKKILLITSLIFIFSCNKNKEKTIISEISCGQCKFDLTSQKGCDLAIKIDEKPYFLDGFNIDDFGDAHNKHTGFCEVVRKGKARGVLVNNRFKATSIELID